MTTGRAGSTPVDTLWWEPALPDHSLGAVAERSRAEAVGHSLTTEAAARTEAFEAAAPLTARPATPVIASVGTGHVRSWSSTIAAAAETVLLAVLGLVVAVLLVVDVGPRFLPYQALVVRSGSMSPTIPTGSLVVYKKAQASALKVGDVIVFNEPGTASTKVTHRIYAIHRGPSGEYFTTKGDANGAPDPWRVPATGAGWMVWWHVPAVGYPLTWIQNGTVRTVLIVVPAVALAGLALNDARRARRKEAAGDGGVDVSAERT